MTGALLSLSPDDCFDLPEFGLAELRMQLPDRRTARSAEDESAFDQRDQNEHGAKTPAAEREQSG